MTYNGNDSFEPELYTLEDENGELTTFELWDTLEENGQVYYALTPVYDDPAERISGDAELVVLKLEDPTDESTLVTIEDDAEYERIGNIFLDRLAEYFDGDDEESEGEEGESDDDDFSGDTYEDEV